MSEEVAIRIAEALESIAGSMRTVALTLICFGLAFWIITVLKN